MEPLGAVDRESRTPKLGATWRIARNVIANEGRGALYRGFSPNLVGNMTSWGLFFMLYVLSCHKVLSLVRNQICTTSDLDFSSFFSIFESLVPDCDSNAAG